MISRSDNVGFQVNLVIPEPTLADHADTILLVVPIVRLRWKEAPEYDGLVIGVVDEAAQHRVAKGVQQRSLAECALQSEVPALTSPVLNPDVEVRGCRGEAIDYTILLFLAHRFGQFGSQALTGRGRVVKRQRPREQLVALGAHLREARRTGAQNRCR